MIEKYEKAGDILKNVKEMVLKIVKPGVRLLDVAEFVESKIVELGGKPAFPCNISINSDAAHFTPKRNDERVFKEGDIVKIDIGAHIDGYIADTAITIDLGDHDDLVECAKRALENAIDVVYAGVNTSEIGAVIEDTIREFGFNPIVNLTGHGLEPYIAHAPPTIYNVRVEKGVELREGMVVAIEPFATDGVGRVVERGECEIFSLVAIKRLRLKREREFLEFIVNEYKTLPFARRWIDVSDVIIARLVKQGILRSYPVLTEVGGGLVSQFEHTLIVEEDGAKVIT
ncbi:MAG: type II methionyl aminopeptidase [Archaeoglobales archaeon]|nr:MAG: type II methionyl aminopeptidase [Archaeoglobales archaeon]